MPQVLRPVPEGPDKGGPLDRSPHSARAQPWLNGAIALGLTLGVLGYLYGVKFGGNLTGFFRIGDLLPFSPFLDPSRALIARGELGYDGQQFLTLAWDPLLRHPGTIAALDSPAYRYRRIFYPALAHLLALGHRPWIPVVMVAINGCCIPLLVGTVSWGLGRVTPPAGFSAVAFGTGGVGCGAKNNKKYWGSAGNAAGGAAGQKSLAWQPLLALCIPGIWISLAFSTADLLASTLMAIALCLHRARAGRRPYRYPALGIALAIALACLTRETMLLVWFALGVSSLVQRDWPQLGALMVAGGPPLAWGQYVAQLGLPRPGDVGQQVFGWPLAGLLHKVQGLWAGGFTAQNSFELYGIVLLMGVFVWAIALACRFPLGNRVILLCASLYGGLLLMSGAPILEYYAGYLRVYGDGFLFLLLAVTPYPQLKTWPLVAGLLPSLAFIVLSS